jgi:mono/diheme cytochrome c family protein
MRGLQGFLFSLALALVGGAARSQDVTPGDRERGGRLWVDYLCYSCHGRAGQGGSFNGPHLHPEMSYEAFEAQLRAPARRMPPYRSAILPQQDLADLYAFLHALRPSPSAPR